MAQQRGRQAQKQVKPAEQQGKSTPTVSRSEEPVEVVQEILGSRAGSRQVRSALQQADVGGVPQPQSLHSLLQSVSPISPRVQAKPLFRGVSQEWSGAVSMGLVIQPKLTVGAAGDQYEQEADRVAAEVVKQMHSPGVASANEGQVVQRMGVEEDLRMKPMPLLQREVMDEDDELQLMPIMQRVGAEGGEVSADVEGEINRARGGGQSLAPDLQVRMGQAMGADFSGVRVHTDGRADGLNRMVGARAFTTGQDLFFKRGEYQPGSRGGQELIAHELTHVMQQNGQAVKQKSAQETMQTFPCYSKKVTHEETIVQNTYKAKIRKSQKQGKYVCNTRTETSSNEMMKEKYRNTYTPASDLTTSKLITRTAQMQRMQLIATEKGKLEEDIVVLNNIAFAKQINKERGVKKESIFSIFDAYSAKDLDEAHNEIIFIHGHGVHGMFRDELAEGDYGGESGKSLTWAGAAAIVASKLKTDAKPQQVYEVRLMSCSGAVGQDAMELKEAREEPRWIKKLVKGFEEAMVQEMLHQGLSGTASAFPEPAISLGRGKITYATAETKTESGRVEEHPGYKDWEQEFVKSIKEPMKKAQEEKIKNGEIKTQEQLIEFVEDWIVNSSIEKLLTEGVEKGVLRALLPRTLSTKQLEEPRETLTASTEILIPGVEYPTMGEKK